MENKEVRGEEEQKMSCGNSCGQRFRFTVLTFENVANDRTGVIPSFLHGSRSELLKARKRRHYRPDRPVTRSQSEMITSILNSD
jgi:hypothetical protein